MTANQIAYERVREDARYHRAQDRRAKEANAISRLGAEASMWQASTAAVQASETARHNQEQERYNWWYGGRTTQEANRHNLAVEGTERDRVSSLSEYQRNQAIALQRQSAVAERQAAVSERQAAVAERGAAVNERNAAVNESNAISNRIQAQAASRQATTSAGMLAESIRSNLARESLSARQQNEIERTNLRNESIQVSKNNRTLKETQRHNQAMEANNALANSIAETNADTARLNAWINAASSIPEGFKDFALGFGALTKFGF